MSLKTSVTIRQVADEAGVSIQTVSRVINNRYDVAQETRQRVQQAIHRLGYQPNAIARGLASRRSRTLGLIAFDFTDTFVMQMLTGAEQEARRSGYVIVLGRCEAPVNDEPRYLHLLTERHVEGIIFTRLASVVPENEPLLELKRAGIPVVMTGFHPSDGSEFNTVDIDNVSGGRAATECLVHNGHRQVATVTGPFCSQAAHDRLRGYRLALESAGIDYDEDLVVEGDYTFRSGNLAAQKLLDRKKPFTALFAQNDRMAVGAMAALRRAGYSFPEDISIVGYDDIPEGEYMDPPLTTVRQPLVAMGVEAVRMLVRQIEEPEALTEQIFMGTELVVRGSVRPVKTIEEEVREPKNINQ
jgi:LacI family transcriptional regulator